MTKCALVTGASGGIGAAIASELAAQGHAVAVCYYQNEAAAHSLVASLQAQGATAAAFGCDLRQAQQVPRLFAAVAQQLGNVDILVNNAGIAQQKLVQDITAEEWDDMMNTHVRAAFLCAQQALPNMIQKKQGIILNISSMWGQVGASCEVHYSTAKAALIGFTKALAKEVAPSGVRVNALAPGAVETAMLAGFTQADKQLICDETPLGRLGTAQEIAQAAAFLCSDAGAFITGQVLGVNGGMVM